jgi:hypothetical protein
LVLISVNIEVPSGRCDLLEAVLWRHVSLEALVVIATGAFVYALRRPTSVGENPKAFVEACWCGHRTAASEVLSHPSIS